MSKMSCSLSVSLFFLGWSFSCVSRFFERLNFFCFLASVGGSLVARVPDSWPARDSGHFFFSRRNRMKTKKSHEGFENPKSESYNVGVNIHL